MEEMLNELVTANSPVNRMRWAEKWKSEGRKIIGLACIYVPEEIISAAGMVPWRVTGTWDDDLSRAGVYRQSISCRYCTHVLEAILRGDLAFLDGLVISQMDDDFKRLYDVVEFIGKPEFRYLAHVPQVFTPTALKMWTKEVVRFRVACESFSGKRIGDGEVEAEIEIYNKMRGLLKQLYHLKQRKMPPLTGAETLGIVTAARIMPREVFVQKLGELMPYVENRQAYHQVPEQRVLLIGEFLDHPEYIRLIENLGAAVAVDVLDNGLDYFSGMVESWSGNPCENLARRYLQRPGTSRMGHWAEQIVRIIDLVKEYHITGVIDLKPPYSLPSDFRSVLVKKRLEEADIPYLGIQRGYAPSQVGMLGTRIGAFIEILGQHMLQ